MKTLELRCRCGTIRGTATGVAPNTTNRLVCYCDDCQAFLQRIGRADLLDSHGGSDIVQVAPQALRFEDGVDRIVGLRLSPKGLFRYYASCCKTPLGNTFSAAIPFVGVAPEVFVESTSPDALDAAFGPPRGHLAGKWAIGTPPPGSTDLLQPRFLARTLGQILRWKLQGKGFPHPFFERNGALRYPVTTLTHDERERLRPLCGPKSAT